MYLVCVDSRQSGVRGIALGLPGCEKPGASAVAMMDARKHRHLLATIVFTVSLLSLIALALGNTRPGIAFAVLFSVLVLALSFHFLLPGGEFFSAVFANSIGIFACIYVFFLGENFPQTGALAQEAGFVLPLAGFLIGAMWRRNVIVGRVRSSKGDIRVNFGALALWALPLAAVAAASFILPIGEMGAPEQDAALLFAMTIIGLTAAVTAPGIAAFLLDTAMLFENFFFNAGRLVKPAFAFLTCYSLLTIIYGCLYTIIDRFSPTPNFNVFGAPRAITLSEGLYLSVVTLSTVGYGDLTASSGIARALVASEIVTGVLLLLFGVQAILSSDRR